jgi:hypothetical protein
MKRAAAITVILIAALAPHALAQAPDSTATARADTAAAAKADTIILTDGVSGGGLMANQAAAQTQATAADTVRVPWITPTWKVDYRANESEYRMGTGMNLAFEPGGGWHAASSLKLAKRNYRGRDMSDIDQNFNNTAVKIVPSLYTLNLALGQDYRRQKAVGLARSGGDMVIENKFFNTGFTWERPEFRARQSRFAVLGRAGGGQNDFKYDDNYQANASGHLWYGFGTDLAVSGGYGVWRRIEDSDVSGRVFENMKSDMDTISAKASYGRGDYKLLSVDYSRHVGVVRQVNPPRGNSLEIIENPDLAQMEESSRESDRIMITSRIEPSDYLSVDVEFLRDYFDQQNVVDERLSQETLRKRARGKAVYRYADKGRLDFDIERRENDVDFGPQSLSSYVEKEQVLKAAITQSISDSVKVSVRGSGSLKQRFYKKPDANPRDADDLYYALLADLDARLPLKILAGVKFTYKQYQKINIDQSLSNDNRTDYTYWVVPRFTLRPSNWFEIGQEYEIKMEFTDFNFKQNENFLDRTTIMNTRASFKILKSRLNIRHRYQFIDTGSYLEPPEGGERVYRPTNESFDHRFDFRFDYLPTPDFSIFTYSNYRFQESNRLGAVNGEIGVVSSSFFDSGEMTLGFSRLARLSKSSKVDLNVAWVKRFGPNLTPERREFWEIDMNMEIKF